MKINNLSMAAWKYQIIKKGQALLKLTSLMDSLIQLDHGKADPKDLEIKKIFRLIEAPYFNIHLGRLIYYLQREMKKPD